MKKYIKPDFTNSNLNISSTLAKYLGAPNDKPTIKILEDELKKGYRNILFICYDGMGIHPIKRNLGDDSFLKGNIKKVLTSTFPSTTTNATTSLLSNKYPLEHGWFGWSLNFQAMNKNIDIFPKRDSFTAEPIEITSSPIEPQPHYFNSANTDYEIHTILPTYVETYSASLNHPFKEEADLFNNIKTILTKPGKHFIYSYYGEPDTTMHEFGVTSVETKKLIERLDKKTYELYRSTKDTLFIITADHGQVDIEGYVDFYGDKKLMDMLKIYPYLDARAVAFKVKDGYHKEFEKYFKKTYKKDFILHKSEDLIKDGYFGPVGDKGYLLGDFIAIGTFTHKTAIMTPISHRFKGHHTSLTEEMEVPLIMFNN